MDAAVKGTIRTRPFDILVVELAHGKTCAFQKQAINEALKFPKG